MSGRNQRDKQNLVNHHQTLTALLGAREGKLLGGAHTTAPVRKAALPGLLAKWLTSSRHPDYAASCCGWATVSPRGACLHTKDPGPIWVQALVVVDKNGRKGRGFTPPQGKSL